jgi:anti-sigma regulatory factor (Ser/Thr protein kinase)
MSGRLERGGSRHQAAAVPASVPAMRRALDRVLAAEPITERRAADIRLALTEACTNVVQHAYPDDAPGDVVVIFQSGHDALTVSVLDSGRGLAATPEHPGLGLGLTVIEALADSVAIADLQPGTGVRMTFERPR